MVVSLRDSDDSDSDGDTGGSSQTVFGGLEFMIKEARRTAEVNSAAAARGRGDTAALILDCRDVLIDHQILFMPQNFHQLTFFPPLCMLHGAFQASKPKAATGSEKENNPVRTPEALPDAKKAEYRLLREEIAK